MYLKPRTTISTKQYWEQIERIQSLLQSAQRIIVGVGAGMSAAGGLNYADPELVKKWFPEYRALGLHTLLDIQSRFWRYDSCKPEAYWGYWARHIWHIRHETGVLQPYRDLFWLLQGKNYFICSTNVDGQLEKAGFARDRIFAPQGDYRYFQCSRPCGDTLYPNRDMIEKMISRMPDAFEIRTDDIPCCANCGAPLIPNLRCDDTFVEAPHIQNIFDYENFVQDCRDKATLLLELGVGYNTPAIIRYPFETMAKLYPKATLVRLNLTDAEIPETLFQRGIEIGKDIKRILADIREKEAGSGHE